MLWRSLPQNGQRRCSPDTRPAMGSRSTNAHAPGQTRSAPRPATAAWCGRRACGAGPPWPCALALQPPQPCAAGRQRPCAAKRPRPAHHQKQVRLGSTALCERGGLVSIRTGTRLGGSVVSGEQHRTDPVPKAGRSAPLPGPAAWRPCGWPDLGWQGLHARACSLCAASPPRGPRPAQQRAPVKLLAGAVLHGRAHSPQSPARQNR